MRFPSRKFLPLLLAEVALDGAVFATVYRRLQPRDAAHRAATTEKAALPPQLERSRQVGFGHRDEGGGRPGARRRGRVRVSYVDAVAGQLFDRPREGARSRQSRTTMPISQIELGGDRHDADYSSARAMSLRLTIPASSFKGPAPFSAYSNEGL